eukprot:3607882-Amphidinium_carterae.1
MLHQIPTCYHDVVFVLRTAVSEAYHSVRTAKTPENVKLQPYQEMEEGSTTSRTISPIKKSFGAEEVSTQDFN